MSGKLVNNALVMYDRQTRSLWSQFLSFSVDGDFKGAVLEPVPLLLTTWEEWKLLHPDTIALRKPSNSSRDQYEGYYASNDAGVIGESVSDNRLPRKELVLGVGFDDGPVAFAHSQMSSERVINTVVAGEHTVVFYETGSATAVAYRANVGGRSLTFSLDHREGRDWLIDDETGSRWLPLTGQAVSGSMAGESLRRVHAVNVFWFAWTDFYPGTELFEAS